jgi:hypothetical protein
MFTLLTTAGVVNPMALPVVSLMLPAFNAGDVNGDGLDDLIVGAYQADLSGKSNPMALPVVSLMLPAFKDKAVVVAVMPVVAVSPLGDVNGDGLDDLIVGAHQANLSSGKSYVVFGKQTQIGLISPHNQII